MPKSIYVLELENGKWYVGTTSLSVDDRLKEHKKGGYRSAAWTRLHKPLRVVLSRECAPGRHLQEERRVTYEYMIKYGAQHVRGGPCVRASRLTPDDLDHLVDEIAFEFDYTYQCARDLLFRRRPVAVVVYDTDEEEIEGVDLSQLRIV